MIQAKLSISQPGDSYEQEADRVADQVLRMPDAMAGKEASAMEESQPVQIQRACTDCEEELSRQAVEEEEEDEDRAIPVASQTVEEEEDEYPPASQDVIYRKAEFATPRTTAEPAAAITDRVIGRQSGGEPLPAVTRQKMETAFGYDFSRVRLHRDAEAGEISRQISAHAFTHGNHIYFGHGKYDPVGAGGSRLLAHELTHVVQQGEAAPQQSSNAATPAAVRSHTPAIQRVATWTAGPVHQVRNLANSVINGQAVGVTWPMLNASTFWSTARARKLLNKPRLAFAPVAAGGVDATVAGVSRNIGSFDETVLKAGPWRLNVRKSRIGAMFPALAACTGGAKTRFQAIGDPSDADMFAANRRHENHHATDHEAAFNGSIVPWDANLTAAQTAGTTFNGANRAAARAALFAAMGGTPNDVADAYMNACAAAVVAFHGTPAGGAVRPPTNPTANATCSTSSAEYFNPS